MSNDPDMKEQLNRIERCLVGDEKMGQLGVVARLNNHGARIGRLERLGMYGAGAVGAMTLLYKIATEWIR